MNMGDELGAATVHVATNIAQSTISTVANLIAEILKMIQASKEHNLRMSELGLKSGVDISDIKPGEVKMKDLINSARKNGDSISTSEHGVSLDDSKKLAKIAKEYGVPVSFTNSGDSVHAHVRSKDLPIFKQMFTDMMRDKLNSKPQDLGNFKVQSWEIPYITAELNRYELNAQFGKTKNGEYFCMYDKADEKAILIARGEFIKKYNDVKKDFMVDKDEEGFYTLKDINTGKEISFDDSKKSYRGLSEELQKNFGYDKNKADIAAAKFGEENLKGEEKENYFSNPQNDTKSIITNINFENEDVYTSQYTCMRVVPKEDSIQRIVFADNEGRFAVINPNMKTSEIADELKNQLCINDKKEIDSLVGKAEKAMLYYAKREDATRYSSEYNFTKTDFDLSDIDTISGMRRETDGHVYTRELPLDSLNLKIERNGKDSFTVTSDAVHIETTESKELSKSIESKTISFSFSDKKKAIHELEQIFVDQGVPESVAKRAAFDTFGKAESQETEKIVTVEEIKTESAVYYSDNLKVEAEIYCSGKTATVDITNPDKGIQQIENAFGVSKNQASEMYNDVSDKLTDRQLSVLEKFGYDCEDWTVGEASFVIEKIAENEWKIPEGMEPSDFSIDNYRDISGINAEKTIPEPEIDIDDIDEVMSMGGR